MCEISGCPRRVVSYREKNDCDVSKPRRLREHTSKEGTKRMSTDQYSALHIQEPKDSREIHASNCNHIATAEVEIVVFESLDVIETTTCISKYQGRDKSC
jgi:hypothetical protein